MAPTRTARLILPLIIVLSSASMVGCSNESPSGERSARDSLFEKFSVLHQGRSTMPPSLWRKTSGTITRQFHLEPSRGEVWYAGTPVGGLWLVLAQDLACLVSHPDGALACSPVRPVLRTGLSIGAFSPPVSGSAPSGYWIKGFVPDRVVSVDVQVGERSRRILPNGNAFGVRAEQAILIRGFTSLGEHTHPQGQPDA